MARALRPGRRRGRWSTTAFSPGDDGHAEPYLYVGPHEGPPATDPFWNATFGATVATSRIGAEDDAVAFYAQGHRQALERQEQDVKGLQGKRRIVTGGSSGIGQAIAIRLGEEGVNVAINYVGPPEGAEETKEAIEHGVDICMKQMAAAGTRPLLVEADVSRRGRRSSAMFEQVIERVRPASTS